MSAVVLLIWALAGVVWSLVIWREVADMRHTPTTKPGRSRHIKTPDRSVLASRWPVRAPLANSPRRK